jgi:hypothetical protein
MPHTTARYRLICTHNGTQSVVDFGEVTTPALDAVPAYHSRPGAKQIIYLDFTGYVDDFAGSVLSAQLGLEDASLTYVKTSPFSYTGYSQGAPYPTANAIYDIWRMVTEDFAAFDVDVTTEAPAHDALIKSSAEDMHYGKRVVIGYAEGTSEPWYVGGGGFSGGGTFGFQHDRPAYIFANSSRRNIAAQITHEVSHTLGLAHDGGKPWFTWFQETPYYRGEELTRDGDLNFTGYLQTGLTWFPVMGGAPAPTFSNSTPYDSPDEDFINQWSRGNYSSATNTEDDFAILLGLIDGNGRSFTETPLYPASARNITLAKDDFGDTLASAELLGYSTFSKQGVIGKHLSNDGQTVENDVDCFKFFALTGGDLTLKVVPNSLGLTEGASLDAKLEVLDHNGTVLQTATEPIWEENETFFPDIRNAELTITLSSAGTYYVRVSGTVHPVTSTSISADGSASSTNPWRFNDAENYGSIGPYSLTGTFAANETLVFPKPSTEDSTDFTDDAKARILVATNGIIPSSIILNNGQNTPITAADLSNAISVFSGCLQWNATTKQLSVNYHFNVTRISVTNNIVHVTVAVSGNGPISFTQFATFEKVDAQTGETSPLAADSIEGKSEITFTLLTENSTQLFFIRIKTKDISP